MIYPLLALKSFKPHEENWEKAWYHSHDIKLHGGLDHDIHKLSVPVSLAMWHTHEIAID